MLRVIEPLSFYVERTEGYQGAVAKVAERLLELQLLFARKKRKAGSEEPAIHGIIRYD